MATDIQSRPPEKTEIQYGQHPPPLEPQASNVSTGSQAARVKPVTLCVFTMKSGGTHKVVFPSGRLTTAQQVIDEMLRELGIPKENEKTFSIWLTSKHLQLQLKPYHLPCKLFKRWKDLLSQYTNANYESVQKDEPILSFRRNAFFELREERKLLDPKKDNQKSIDLLYHEAVFNVTKGRYPVTKDELHSLAGLQAAVAAAERGDANPQPAAIKSDLNIFYPAYMVQGADTKKIGRLFKQRSVENKAVIEEFSKAFNDAWKKSTTPLQLKILYLQICWHKPFYGCTMFRGLVKRPPKDLDFFSEKYKEVVVAINPECVHLFSFTTPPDILLYLTYDQLSWNFEEAGDEGEQFFSSLLIEFDSVAVPKGGGEEQRVNKRIQILSRQAPMMDAMIVRCVAGIDERERELRRKRLEQGNDEYLPDVKIVCDESKTQKQEKNYKEHKLQCTVFTQDGSEVVEENDGFFTMPKAFRKRGSRHKKQMSVDKEDSTEQTGAAEKGGEATATGVEEVPLKEVEKNEDSKGLSYKGSEEHLL